MLPVDFTSFWDALLAASAPLILGFFVTRTKKYKTWRAQRKEYAEQIRAMASKFADFEASVHKHLDDQAAARGRTTTQFKAIDDRLTAQDKVLATIMSMTMGQFEMSATPSFVCDSDARNTNVNAAYAALLGVGRDDLMDFRYRSFIPKEILGPHLALFKEAAAEHREFENEIVMMRGDRTPLHLRVHMIPYPRDIGPATHWVGTITMMPDGK